MLSRRDCQKQQQQQKNLIASPSLVSGLSQQLDPIFNTLYFIALFWTKLLFTTNYETLDSLTRGRQSPGRMMGFSEWCVCALPVWHDIRKC